MRVEYVHIAWKTSKGGWRRSFALAPTPSGKHLVSYVLVENDTDGKNETVIGFANDSTIRVRPARLNPTYCELEVVERLRVDAVDGHDLLEQALAHNAVHNSASRIDVEVNPKATPNGDDDVLLVGMSSVLRDWLKARGYDDGEFVVD